MLFFKNIIHRLDDIVRDLSPTAFAIVMATGIVSNSAWLLGMTFLALVLFWISVSSYLVIWVMSAVRTVMYPRRVFADLMEHSRVSGFFTSVAGTCVLGTEIILVFGNYRLASALWLFGLILWIGLTYTIFTVLIIKESKPSLAEGINGARGSYPSSQRNRSLF